MEAETFFRVLEVASTSAEDVVETPCLDSRIAGEQFTLKSWIYAISKNLRSMSGFIGSVYFTFSMQSGAGIH